MTAAPSEIEAAAALELLELRQAGLRIQEPRACSHSGVHEGAVSSLEHTSASVQLDSAAGTPIQLAHSHGDCRESALCDAERAEEELALQDLQELYSCGLAVRWTPIHGHAKTASWGSTPSGG